MTSRSPGNAFDRASRRLAQNFAASTSEIPWSGDGAHPEDMNVSQAFAPGASCEANFTFLLML